MLDLRIGPGRRAVPLEATVVRVLSRADLEHLRGERGVQPIPIKALRERHHAIARHLASGLSETEVSAITGMTISRISILKSDPTFAELLAFYRKSVDAQYADMHANLAGLATDAIAIMRERLEDAPENISDARLSELIKLGADRTGFGPQTKNETNINVNLADRLKAARERVAERRAMIDITPQEAAE